MDQVNIRAMHKFGGSSLKDADCFVQVEQLVVDQPVVIVVSAMGKTTRLLQAVLDTAAMGAAYASALDAVVGSVREAAVSLLEASAAEVFTQGLAEDQQQIAGILETVCFTKHCDVSLQEVVLGFGEKWSARLLTAYMQHCGRSVCTLDASTVLVIEKEAGVVAVDWAQSEALLSTFMDDAACDVIVVTGFIARDAAGHQTTLGPNSSDYSAAIFAKLFNSPSLTIWTDVDGVMSADPAQVPAAFVLETLSYQEALELAYFGASVIHPLTIPLAMSHCIPILIKNTFQPAEPGTWIREIDKSDTVPVKGLTSIPDMVLLNIEGAGMIGVSGIAACAFAALQQQRISVVFISQASSEYSICIAIKKEEAARARAALEEAFAYDLHHGRVEKIRVDEECAIVAIVGEGMIGHPGISSRLCGALAASRINIRAIAQGSSERNVSIVVHERDLSRALRAIHSAYHLSNKTLSVGLIGPGQIGSTLLAQLSAEAAHLSAQYGINIRLRGVMNSRHMVLDDREIPLDGWEALLSSSDLVADVGEFIRHIRSDDIPHAVLIDATASDAIASHYVEAIERGLHIITPNKRANSGEWSYYRSVQQALSAHQRHYLYETTVCAGLPVISTIRDILNTGDQIETIEGVFSGTLGYIFGQVAGGCAFSEAVLSAYEQGYTEPDPRDDLSGMDVARKTICLAREIGLTVSMEDLQIDNLVPEAYRSCDRETFLQKLPECDQQMADLLAERRADGVGVHYVGRIKASGEVSVGLVSYAADHQLAGLRGTDNIVVIHTQRYHDQPLVVQGPGAGASVTAAGVFADMLRLISQL